MKICVVGSGALGLYYGACLARRNADTHILFRGDCAEAARGGVRVDAAEGGWTVRPECHSGPETCGPCDLVIIAIKTTGNGRLPDLVRPLMGDKTAVLTLQNGLGNEEQLARFASSDSVLGGLCFVSLNRTAPGVVRHIHGGRILMGEFSGAASSRTRDLAAIFHDAGIPCDVTDDLALAHWLKLVWNIPFNGLGVAGAAGLEAVRSGILRAAGHVGGVLPTDVLLGDPAWRAETAGLMREVIAAAGACGHPIDPGYAESELERTAEMGSYRASTLVDFELGRPLELDAIFGEPLRRARAAGAHCPRLERLVAVLTALAARRG
jgi:2-dehydropantoate 2-reductase